MRLPGPGFLPNRPRRGGAWTRLRPLFGLADAELGQLRRRARQLGLASWKTVSLQHQRDRVEVLLGGEAVRVVLRHGPARLLEEGRHRLPLPIREEPWSDERWHLVLAHQAFA